LEILTFELSGQRFGIHLRSVREVVRAVAISPLPGAPSVIEGIIDVRGEVVPVFDLRARFGLLPRPVWPTQHLIIARVGDRLVAVRVDRAEWMVEVEDGAVVDATRVASSAKHIAGVATLEDGLVLIHDLDTFLNAFESQALEEAMMGASPERTG
jgi:purine-binding chemotaxis protein CheW